MEITSKERLDYVVEKLELNPKMVCELFGVLQADFEVTKDLATKIDRVFEQVKIACESLHYRQVIEGRKTNKGDEILHLQAGTFCNYFQGILDGPKTAPKKLCDIKPGGDVKVPKRGGEMKAAFVDIAQFLELGVCSTMSFLGCSYERAEAWLSENPARAPWNTPAIKEAHRLSHFKHQLKQLSSMPEGRELMRRRKAGEEIDTLLIKFDLEEAALVSRLAADPDRYFYSEEEKKKMAKDRARVAKREARDREWAAGEAKREEERKKKRAAAEAKLEAKRKAEAAKSKSLKAIEGVLFQIEDLERALRWAQAQLEKEGPQVVPDTITTQLEGATQRLGKALSAVDTIKSQVFTEGQAQLEEKKKQIRAAKAKKQDETLAKEQAKIRQTIAKAPVEKMADLAERMAELGRERRKLQEVMA